MALHLLRDYQTQDLITGNRRWIFAYLLTIFLRRVLVYSYVGDTNFPINPVGTLLIATGDTTPTGATPTFPAGTRAGINLGLGKEFYVSIPVSVRTVSGADVGRILALKSTANPTFNSGLFIIAGFDTVTNSYIVDYRTLGDKPPVEAADSINWYLYEKDVSCPTQGAVNNKPSGSYFGDGTSTTPRIILQSPHALGWQVRICNETSTDVSQNGGTGAGTCPTTSVSPGFGGNVSGDFPTFGQHFHAPMWNNSNLIAYLGGAPGMSDNAGAGIQYRVTAVGDDTGQSVVMYMRRQGDATSPSSSILVFGFPNNEPTPLPVNNTARLFCIGGGYSGGSGNGMNDGGLYASTQASAQGTIGGNAFAQGMTQTPFGVPAMVAASFWTYVTGVGQQGGPHFDGSAGDNPFISATELLPLDLVQATVTGWNTSNNATPVYPLAPRAMGTIPLVFQGRTNFGEFSPSTDPGRAFQHLRRGLYIPWNGPSFVP